MLSTLPARAIGFCAPVALCAALASCNQRQEAATPASTFTGQVVLHDEAGTLLPDHSGIVVSLYDTPNVSTTTTADGRFSLANVAAGSHRLQFQKSAGPLYYGTYYTDEITATAPIYALPRTIHLGQRLMGPQNYYAVTYSSDNANKRFIVTGVRKTSISTNTGSLYHRIFLDLPVGYDGSLDLSDFKYSKLYHNNMASGFSDTIPFSVLAAKTVRQSTYMVVLNDTPKTDSCTAPFSSTFPNNNAIKFARSYPAVGGFSGYITVVWGQ